MRLQDELRRVPHRSVSVVRSVRWLLVQGLWNEVARIGDVQVGLTCCHP